MTRKYAVLLAFAVTVLLAASANAQYSRVANIVTTNHNMSSTGPNTTVNMKAVSNTQVCYYCHVPHQMLENPQDATVTDDPNGQGPLWNHYLSNVGSYGVYSSPSFDALGTDITDMGGAVEGSANESNLCLSCHDGTVGINTLYKGQYNSAGRLTPDFGLGINVPVYMMEDAQIGSDTRGLRDEHPLNFTYDAALAAKSRSLAVPTTSTAFGGVRLGLQPTTGNFLPLFSGKMQCATCHDAHDNSTYRPFLRASTTGSAICLACHGK